MSGKDYKRYFLKKQLLDIAGGLVAGAIAGAMSFGLFTLILQLLK